MTALERESGAYWRQSRAFRGFTEGDMIYPKVAEGLLTLLSETAASEYLKKLAKLNVYSRNYAQEEGKVLVFPAPKSRALVPMSSGIDALV